MDKYERFFVSVIIMGLALMLIASHLKVTPSLTHSIPYCFSKAHGMSLPCMYKSGELDA